MRRPRSRVLVVALFVALVGSAAHLAYHLGAFGQMDHAASSHKATGFASSAPGQQPTTPPSPPAPGAPLVAPSPPAPPGFDNVGDSIASAAESLGQAGRDLGKQMRQRFGKHFGDSLATVVRSRIEHERVAREVGQAHAEAQRAAAEGRRVAMEAQRAADGGQRGLTVAQLIARAREDPEAIPLPPADSFVAGGYTVSAGQMVPHTVATVNGNLDVSGMVSGNAIAINGDVILHSGAHVTGSAFATNGEVRFDSTGALVEGEIRSLQGPIGVAPAVATGRRASGAHPAKLALAAFGLVMLLGIGVLIFAEEQLDNVSATLVEHFGRAAWYGVVGEIALAPGLLVVIVALAITLVGVLAVPFVIVGAVVLTAGAASLGFMAVAEATGSAVLRSRSQNSLTPRGAQLRAMVTGITIYGVLWVLTAAVGTGSGIGIFIRAVVLIVTVVAVTVGFGAVLLWRFEVRRAHRLASAVDVLPASDAVWQTPTPVAGVAAARRPTPPTATATRTPE
jgi:hypothetical protein